MPRYKTSFLKGDTINKTYRLTHPLGVGGLGDVWAAEHCQTGDSFALKLLQPQHMGNAELKARMRREFAVLERARHPSVVLCHGRGEVWEWMRDGHPLDLAASLNLPFLILELIKGDNLHKVLRSKRESGTTRTQRACTLREATRILEPILKVLDSLHHAGILHRDLKPGNIVLDTRRRTAKLLDWNLGKVPGDQPQLTKIGHKDCGSPPYCSPEQLISLFKANIRSDIYSMAAVMVEALTGIFFRYYLDADNKLHPARVARALQGKPWIAVGNEPYPVGGSGPVIPAELAAVLVRSLSLDMNDRPSSMLTLLQALVDADSELAVTKLAGHFSDNEETRRSQDGFEGLDDVTALAPRKQRSSDEPPVTLHTPSPELPEAPERPSAPPQAALPELDNSLPAAIAQPVNTDRGAPGQITPAAIPPAPKAPPIQPVLHPEEEARQQVALRQASLPRPATSAVDLEKMRRQNELLRLGLALAAGIILTFLYYRLT